MNRELIDERELAHSADGSFYSVGQYIRKNGLVDVEAALHQPNARFAINQRIVFWRAEKRVPASAAAAAAGAYAAIADGHGLKRELWRADEHTAVENAAWLLAWEENLLPF